MSTTLMSSEHCPGMTGSAMAGGLQGSRGVFRAGRSLLVADFRSRSKFTAARNSKSMKVALLGAAGPTGTCLSMFLKQSPLIDELAIHDARPIDGLALELNHIDTRCRITSCSADQDTSLMATLEDAKIVMVAAGEPRGQHDSMDEVLHRNADVLADLIPAIIRHCPRSLVAVITEPVNSLIPMVHEMYKKVGVQEEGRLFGVTSLDCVRANTFAAQILGLPPECVLVPVIGGSCPQTCVPLLSKAKPSNEFTAEEVNKLVRSLRNSSNEVRREYGGGGSSTLAMAFAAARFCVSLCKGLRDQKGVVECAYVRSCVVPEVSYFSAPILLGPNGVQKHLGVPPLEGKECKLVDDAIPPLKAAIKKGEALALGPDAASSETCPPGAKCDIRKFATAIRR
ncbi:probable malate dehydrogenase, mitochondrial [Orussus abietinus]|uniref:probable malate dehydrogenase, mitochondrial n=1 Tax=Orussus abietinus TaxID=222816 RepID=UPI0006250D15|nr:probable malate dehydrogenase, mitochondrial [Orussus abietinus]